MANTSRCGEGISKLNANSSKPYEWMRIKGPQSLHGHGPRLMCESGLIPQYALHRMNYLFYFLPFRNGWEISDRETVILARSPSSIPPIPAAFQKAIACKPPSLPPSPKEARRIPFSQLPFAFLTYRSCLSDCSFHHRHLQFASLNFSPPTPSTTPATISHNPRPTNQPTITQTDSHWEEIAA